MKILMLTELFAPFLGGLEVHVETLADGLIRRGHEVSVATMAPGPDRQGNIAVHRLTSTAARLGQGPSYQTPLPDPEGALGLRRVLRSEDPDIIHTHNWAAASSVFEHKYPLVHTVHDYSLICARRDLFRSARTSCDGPGVTRCLRCSTQTYGAFRGPVVAATIPIGRRLLRPKALIAVSKAVADHVVPYLDEPAEVIPNFLPDPVDLPVARSSLPLPAGPFVMFAGAAGSHKGLPMLLEVWRQKLIYAPLVVATPEPEGVPETPGVTVLRLTRAEVLEAWGRAAIAVVPSLWAEPCATVILEALAAGVPVVATDMGGNGELIEHNRSGLLFTPGSSEELVEAIKSLLSSPQRRAAMGEAARRRSEQFRATAVIPRIENVYERVLGGK